MRNPMHSNRASVRKQRGTRLFTSDLIHIIQFMTRSPFDHTANSYEKIYSAAALFQLLFIPASASRIRIEMTTKWSQFPWALLTWMRKYPVWRCRLNETCTTEKSPGKKIGILCVMLGVKWIESLKCVCEAIGAGGGVEMSGGGHYAKC